jgi:pimeloyl-ACP methyl ester carboxylesterase
MSSQQTLITADSVETPSGRISYASAGSGPVALFVHGVVLNKHLWWMLCLPRLRALQVCRRRVWLWSPTAGIRKPSQKLPFQHDALADGGTS